MRWTLRISFLLFLAWAFFMVSPFLALYDLGRAIEAKDLGRISERVNFSALRTSLSRQILGEYLKDQDLEGAERNLAADAGSVALNPFIEQLVTPQALVDLFARGSFGQAAGRGASGTALPPRLDTGSVEEAWKTFIFSESQGFRSVTIPLPIDQPKDKQFRITMRLSNMAWRLTGIELPAPLREELIKRAAVAAR